MGRLGDWLGGAHELRAAKDTARIDGDPPTPGRRRGATLTARAAVLALVLCALLVSAVLPLRDLLAQRQEITRASEAQVEQRARITALEERKRLLEDDAYIEQLSRERLQMVRPGETAYRLQTPSPRPESGPADGAATAPRPWYSRLFGRDPEGSDPEGRDSEGRASGGADSGGVAPQGGGLPDGSASAELAARAER